MGVKKGDTVELHYTAKFDDGIVFDTSSGQEPVRFQVGEGQVIRGVDEGIIGLETGDKTELIIEPASGYGNHQDNLIRQAPREVIGDQAVEKGEVIQLQTSEGEVIPAQVVDTDGESVTFDLNHPLAGKVLKFEVEVVSVLAA